MICDLGNPLKGNEKVILNICHWLSLLDLAFISSTEISLSHFSFACRLNQVSLTLKFETSGIDLYTQEVESQLLLST